MTVAGAFLAGLVAGPGLALTPLQVCDVLESNMRVRHATEFGFAGSGFVIEDYANEMVWHPEYHNGDGGYEQLSGPVPELDPFNGFRVVDCDTGRFLAVNPLSSAEHLELIEADALRRKIQSGQRFTLADVTAAAQALYRGRGFDIITLRETEPTCGCQLFSGQ